MRFSTNHQGKRWWNHVDIDLHTCVCFAWICALDMLTIPPFLCNSMSLVQLGMSWHRIEGHTVTDPSTCVPMCKQVARLSMKSANASPYFKPTATLSQIEAMTQWLCLKLALLLCPRLFNSASLTGFITWSKMPYRSMNENEWNITCNFDTLLPWAKTRLQNSG